MAIELSSPYLDNEQLVDPSGDRFKRQPQLQAEKLVTYWSFGN
jgi:hypothetical protein